MHINQRIAVPSLIVFVACMICEDHVSARISHTAQAEKTIHMVVVFSLFQNEADKFSQPPAWADSMFNGAPGSVDYYFDEISFDTRTVTGEYLQKVYVLPHESSYYSGNMEAYTEDLLVLLDADPDVDFAQFDNDGPDGIPGSGDDDRYVDYLVLMPHSRPTGMIKEFATGFEVLPIGRYTTSDTNSEGKSIIVKSSSGCLATAWSLSMAVGTICHEYIHLFGAVDLYDTKYNPDDEFEIDSAGIGNWGVMGRGVLGWDGDSDPVGPSAFTRIKLRCAGINNEKLIDLYGIHTGIRLKDSGSPDGSIYRIWVTNREYFLIEYRRNDRLYCERNNPANGMLIYHVNDAGNNQNEENKYADLECPDGLYTDAGYPLGTVPDPFDGRDNLDYWSHNTAYNKAHAGNLGDATDVFDGETYTRFGPDTNPNTHAVNGAYTGIEIYNIHHEGDEMVFDVKAPPYTGWISAIPPVGLALQRFVTSYDAGEPAASRTVFLLNTGHEGTDLLIAVSSDSLVVDDISGTDDADLQRLIETRIAAGGIAHRNALITRANCTADDIEHVLAPFNTQLADLAGGQIVSAQKLTLSEHAASAPEAFSLGQNFPNPFNSTTLIPVTLAAQQQVSVDVFNILGQRIKTIDAGMLGAGHHMLSFYPDGLASGLYLYRVRGAAESRSMLYIR